MRLRPCRLVRRARWSRGHQGLGGVEAARRADGPIFACMQSYTIGQAARLLGVSPDTARRWADAGRVRTHRDEGGRRLIDGRDLAAFSVELAKAAGTEEETSYTSVRNAFPGIVTAIKLGDVAAQVE